MQRVNIPRAFSLDHAWLGESVRKAAVLVVVAPFIAALFAIAVTLAVGGHLARPGPPGRAVRSICRRLAATACSRIAAFAPIRRAGDHADPRSMVVEGQITWAANHLSIIRLPTRRAILRSGRWVVPRPPRVVVHDG